jgi:hypothetical protein
MVEPDRVLDDGWWETVSLTGVGGFFPAGMVAQARLTWQYSPLCDRYAAARSALAGLTN